MSKIYGYARCSTDADKQDINRQIRELKDAGADEVIFEYPSDFLQALPSVCGAADQRE